MNPRRWVQRARRRLPDPLVRAVRATALGWGMLTARWRLAPSVIVVGAQRSGTTTLFRLLEEHPELVRPTLSKGTGYFDDHYHRGPRWYRAHFPLRWVARRVTSGAAPRSFECSGYYLFHPLAAERIARDLPDARVVVMLRDPVARAHSAYRHEFSRGFESEPFESALALEEERTRGEAERLLTDPHHCSYEHRHHSYRGRSDYGPQLARFVEAVGRDRIHLIEAERFFADPAGEFAALQDWLGLTPWHPGPVRAWNAEPGTPLPDRLTRELSTWFETREGPLTELLGRPPAWREK
ncbi:sulfotransferase [Nocardioides panacisoli]|uniref:sulfotransferase family protein n=1 Tax=Nocardioides panacisoli TaxID=627624 RepID=UPI001C6391BF|nr:sulfotransferase [Nocardioides panacisoli]QYJ04211.1 sulfotransferase [Nocardioides panacisoli]